VPHETASANTTAAEITAPTTFLVHERAVMSVLP
jgi:hypothetical protein